MHFKKRNRNLLNTSKALAPIIPNTSCSTSTSTSTPNNNNNNEKETEEITSTNNFNLVLIFPEEIEEIIFSYLDELILTTVIANFSAKYREMVYYILKNR